MSAERFLDLRQQHPRFFYRGFWLRYQEGNLEWTYQFELENGPSFQVPWSLALCREKAEDVFRSASLQRILFNLGLVECLSYWKAACSPELVVDCAHLEASELAFWGKLFWLGLGEFRYLNKIEATQESFVRLSALDGNRGARELCLEEVEDLIEHNGGLELVFDYKHPVPSLHQAYAPEEHHRSLAELKRLIPVGGGKDSVVSLVRLEPYHEQNYVYAINPSPASIACMDKASYPAERRLCPKRKLDSQLLELNQKGYLNGHTPFSALVAFSALFCAQLYGIDDIVLSNEASADESSVHGSDINHQYSKSSAFELDFRQFCQTELKVATRYFSFLRPLSELAIAEAFCQCSDYLDCFVSCNRGQAEGKWCGNCPKCLFVALMLLPFIGVAKTEELMGEGFWNGLHLQEELFALLGRSEAKPFECVGTVHEVSFALCLYLNQVEDEATMPALLRGLMELIRDGSFPDLRWTEAGFETVLEENPLTKRYPCPNLPRIYAELVGATEASS